MRGMQAESWRARVRRGMYCLRRVRGLRPSHSRLVPAEYIHLRAAYLAWTNTIRSDAGDDVASRGSGLDLASAACLLEMVNFQLPSACYTGPPLCCLLRELRHARTPRHYVASRPTR